MDTKRLYSRDGRTVREATIWKWRLLLFNVLLLLASAALIWFSLITQSSWGFYVTFIAGFAASAATMLTFFNLGFPFLDHQRSPIQEWVWKKTGWTDQVGLTRDHRITNVTDIVHEIKSYVKEFPDIDMLRTLAINAEACANSYYTLTDQYNHFRGIDTPSATMSRETILRDRDKVTAAQRDVYTAATALVNKERAAVAEDKARALEMAAGSYTGDVSDLVARARDEAVLAREYIDNRQV